MKKRARKRRTLSTKQKRDLKLLKERNESLMETVLHFRRAVRDEVRKDREQLWKRIQELKRYRKMLQERFDWGFFRRLRWIFTGE